MEERRLVNLINRSQLTAVFSVLFALCGFGYNVWRQEATEYNNNLRTSCYQLLLEIAELEQIIFALHFDRERMQSTPRMGWVKARLINDLGATATPEVAVKTENLLAMWASHWEQIETDDDAVGKVTLALDETRAAVKASIESLR